MTDLELVRRAIMTIAAGSPPPNSVFVQETELSAMVPSVMQGLADEVAKDANRAPLLMQTYSVDLVNGEGQPLTDTGSITSLVDILYWSIPFGSVRDSLTNFKLVYIPHREQFEGYLTSGLWYYTLANQRIYTRSATSGDYFNSDRYDVQGPLTVTANFVPTTATLPVTLENDAVDLLVKMVATKIQADKAE
jgi:hypothetical protein